MLTVVPTMIYFLVKDIVLHLRGEGRVDEVRRQYAPKLSTPKVKCDLE